jgi:hypothetical protein
MDGCLVGEVTAPAHTGYSMDVPVFDSVLAQALVGVTAWGSRGEYGRCFGP